MFIREVHLKVSNLARSIDFYSSLFGEECIRGKSRAGFRSGIILFTEKGWKDEAGLPGDFKTGMCLSSTVVLETDEYSRIISNILEGNLLPRVLNIDNEKLTVVDYDLNMLIIRSGRREHAVDDEYTVEKKESAAYSVHS